MTTEPTTNASDSDSRQHAQQHQTLLLITLYVIALAVYVVARYRGMRLDGDSARFVELGRALFDEGRLVPAAGAYNHGFNYSALTVFLSRVCGTSIQSLLLHVRPFLIALIVPVTYVLYREFLQNSRAAIASAFLLYLQPEFLFVTWRGSHELVTWLLVCLALFLLARSFLIVGKPEQITLYVALFYLVMFGLVATTVFFASSFLFAVFVSLVLGWFISIFAAARGKSVSNTRRLVYVTVACFILVFMVVFYLYAPARLVITELPRIGDKVAGLLLTLDAQANPYSTVWISTSVYLGLTVANWLTLGLSFVVWLSTVVRYTLSPEKIGISHYLLVLLYAGFALQIGISMILDFAGVLSANLQLRLFPAFTIVAVPLAAQGVLQIRKRLPATHRTRWAMVSGMLLLVAWLSVASVFKASSEPLVGNKWTFYTPSENSAVEWMASRLRYARIWVGVDERLRELAYLQGTTPDSGLTYDLSLLDPDSRYALVSDVTRLQAQRMRAALPAVTDASQIYNNGTTELYYVRPITPYER